MESAHESPVGVVTGGAGGIGKSICGALAREGIRVVVGYTRSADGARELVDSLPGGGHAALSAPVTDSMALAGFASTITKRYGRCDVLVNCAGTTRFVPHVDLEGLDDNLIDLILAPNVCVPFAVLRSLRPLLHRTPLPSASVAVLSQ